MTGSRAVAVKRAVTDGLATAYAALPAFNGTTALEQTTEVRYGWTEGWKAAEKVFTGRTRGEQPPAALKAGRNFRDEIGYFDLIVVVAAVGGNAEDAEDRALAVGTVAEEWIADRKSGELGAGNYTLRIDGFELHSLFNDRGALAELTYTVRWTARLT